MPEGSATNSTTTGNPAPPMYKLETLVKPEVLDELLHELLDIGVHSLSYSEIYAANKPLFHPRQGKDVPRNVSFIPHIKLEVIIDKGHLVAVEEALAKKVSSPLIGGAEVTVIRLKEGLRVLPALEGEPAVEEI